MTVYGRAELWLYVIKILSLRHVQSLPLVSKAAGQDFGCMQDTVFSGALESRKQKDR